MKDWKLWQKEVDESFDEGCPDCLRDTVQSVMNGDGSSYEFCTVCGWRE